MKGLLIPDMQMPSSCIECLFKQEVMHGTICAITRKRFRDIQPNGRMKICPLIEVDSSETVNTK